MVIRNDLSSLNAYNRLSVNVSGLSKSTEKLASGYRINHAGDDAAGLAISEKMRSQIKGLTQGVRNMQDGINLLQTADGALSEVDSMLHRLSELSEQSANGSYSDIERKAIQQEVDQILEEIDQTSEQVNFNNKTLFSGGGSKTAAATTAAAAASENVPQPQTRALSAKNGETASLLAAEAPAEQRYSPLMAMSEDVLKVQTYAAAPRAASVTTCGDFTVTGGTLGVDFKYENNILAILTATAVEISGTTTTDRIYVEDGVNANITLNNLSITTDSSSDYALGIADNSKGNVNLTLKGVNSLTAHNVALLKQGGEDSGMLTIGGDGELTARSDGGAGIGSKSYSGLGAFNITINGGTINAAAGGGYYNSGAGIGSGKGASAGNITINGGNITAAGHDQGAGIGSGGSYGAAANITVNDGVVNVSSDGSGAGIGSGSGGSASGIKIKGGAVTADTISGAGIGGGSHGDADDITISGGTIKINAANGGAGIGSGSQGDADGITISGGAIEIYSSDGAGIGSGYYGNSGSIMIRDGDIKIEMKEDSYGAGIGGGWNGDSDTITINGGNIKVSAACGAAIGSGREGDSDTITINGGNITAETRNGFGSGAAIGSGYDGVAKNITINGGVVNAHNHYYNGAAIGSGGSGGVDNITINGGTVIAKTEGSGAAIGNARWSSQESKTTNIIIRGNNTVVYAVAGHANQNQDHIGNGWACNAPLNIKRYGGLIIEGDEGFIYGDVTIKDDFTIENGVYVHVDGERSNSHSLTIDNGVTLTNNGTIHVYLHDELPINGTVVNNGLIIYEPDVPADTSKISGGGTIKGQDPADTPEPSKPDNPVDPTPPGGGGGGGTDPVDPTPPGGGGGGGTDPVDPNPPGGGGGGTDPVDPNPPGGGGGTDPTNPNNPGGNGGNNPGGNGSGSGGGNSSGIGGTGFGSTGGENSWWIQYGARSGDGMLIEIGHMSTSALGIGGLNVSTLENANRSIDMTAAALDKVSYIRSTIGAQQNRLEHKLTNVVNTNENLTEAESAIRDTDMAEEMIHNTKYKILMQASQLMLMQSNEVPQSVLQLLG